MYNKKIGVLTSGGDAPGMNNAIAAIVKSCKYNNAGVVGVNYGYKGLLNGDITDIDNMNIDDIINRGGTILGSARCLEFKDPENVKKAVEVAKQLVDDMTDDESSVISVFYGSDVSAETAQELEKAISEAYPKYDCMFYEGGQPLYYYIISVE